MTWSLILGVKKVAIYSSKFKKLSLKVLRSNKKNGVKGRSDGVREQVLINLRILL